MMRCLRGTLILDREDDELYGVVTPYGPGPEFVKPKGSKKARDGSPPVVSDVPEEKKPAS